MMKEIPISAILIELIIPIISLPEEEASAPASIMPMDGVACKAVTSAPLENMNPPTATRIVVITPHRNTCVSPTKPIPMIFPIIRSNGRTDEIITSMIRLVFSSITPCITIAPYIMINI